MKTNDFFDLVSHNKKDKILSGKFKKSWVEETFNFEQPTGKQIKNFSTKTFLGSSISSNKIRLFTFLIFTGILLIISRIFYLQIIKGEEYRTLAENNRIRIRPIASERGLIYDRNGKQLVVNIPNFSLSIIPQDFPRDTEKNKVIRGEIIQEVSDLSGVPKKEIDDLLKKLNDYSYESLVLKENLDYESALKLYIQNAHLPGILIEKGTKRLYQTAGETMPIYSLSHLLGYMGKLDEEELKNLKSKGYLLSDSIGKTGIEKEYEEYLRGTYGQRKIEVDSLGREQSILTEDPPIPGNNLLLTIDVTAQKKLEDLLTAQLIKSKKTKGSAIAMNPQNGEIIAMVSWPTFDNNDFSGGITQEKYTAYMENKDNPFFNRAIAGTYPSGSTAKLMVAAAALQEKIITRYTSVQSVGGIWIDKWFFPDWTAGGHGSTNVTKAIAWSVNTFFYYVGGGYKEFKGLGVEKLKEYFQKFGLGQKTGIDIYGEQPGFVPSPEWKEQEKNEMWYIGDTYNLSIGQGDLLVTPLQVANWTATIVNGGHVYVPHLLKSIIDPVKKTRDEILPKITNENFISPENLAIVKQGMGECVNYGSCRSLLSLPFTTGGKSGTAQWNSTKENHGWFTAFAPYNNPQIVVTVIVEEGEGGTLSAAPVVKEFLAWWGKGRY